MSDKNRSIDPPILSIFVAISEQCKSLWSGNRASISTVEFKQRKRGEKLNREREVEKIKQRKRRERNYIAAGLS